MNREPNSTRNRGFGRAAAAGIGVWVLPAIALGYFLAGWGLIGLMGRLFSEGLARSALLAVGVGVLGIVALLPSGFGLLWFLMTSTRSVDWMRGARAAQQRGALAAAGVVALVAGAVLAVGVVGWIKWESPGRWVALAAFVVWSWAASMSGVVREGELG